MKTIFYHFRDDLYASHLRSDGWTPDSVHFHTCYEATFVRSGELTVLCNGAAVPASGPCIILFRPYTFHEIMAEPGTGFDRYSFHFTAEFAHRWDPELIDMLPMFGRNVTLIAADSELASQIVTLLDTYQHEDAYSRYRRLLLGCFLELVRLHTDGGSQTDSLFDMDPKLRYIHTVADYMIAHFTEQLTTEQLAKQFFISRQKLDLDFKRVMNTTVRQYLLSIRIANAAQLLSAGVGISEVTERCGFSNDSHFIRTFRKRFSISPYQYQKHCGYLVAEQQSVVGELEPAFKPPESSIPRADHPIPGGRTHFTQADFMYPGEFGARKPWSNAFCRAGWTGCTWTAATEDGIDCICVTPIRGRDDLSAHILDFNYYQWDNDCYYPSLDCAAYRYLRVRYKLNRAASATCGPSKFYASPDMETLGTTFDRHQTEFLSSLYYEMPSTPYIWHTLVLDLRELRFGESPWESHTVRQWRYLPFGLNEPSPGAVCYIESIEFCRTREDAERA